MDDAACRQDNRLDPGPDPEDFFPYGRPKESIREMCVKCPVRLKCLAKALQDERSNDGKRYGIFGGLDAGERRKLQKQIDHAEELRKKAQENKENEDDQEDV